MKKKKTRSKKTVLIRKFLHLSKFPHTAIEKFAEIPKDIETGVE